MEYVSTTVVCSSSFAEIMGVWALFCSSDRGPSAGVEASPFEMLCSSIDGLVSISLVGGSMFCEGMLGSELSESLACQNTKKPIAMQIISAAIIIARESFDKPLLMLASAALSLLEFKGGADAPAFIKEPPKHRCLRRWLKVPAKATEAFVVGIQSVFGGLL